MVANAIGTGIQAKFASKRQQKVFKRWVKYCDADGLLDFFGLQAKAYRAMKLSGEVLLGSNSRPYSRNFSSKALLSVASSLPLTIFKNCGFFASSAFIL